MVPVFVQGGGALIHLAKLCVGVTDVAELADWQAWLTRAGDRSAALQDLLWTLLNSREFSCNH